MNKPREEIVADGSRWVGDGPTYIIFLKDGCALLGKHGMSAEGRALLKGLRREVTSGGVTLSMNDLLYVRDDGVPACSEALATFVHSIVTGKNSEKAARDVLKQFSSVVVAARRLANEAPGGTTHERFRNFVTHLAKKSGQVPTRSDIRQAMFPNATSDKLNKNTHEITRLCNENGLSWLPIGESGRPKKDPSKLSKSS